MQTLSSSDVHLSAQPYVDTALRAMKGSPFNSLEAHCKARPFRDTASKTISLSALSSSDAHSRATPLRELWLMAFLGNGRNTVSRVVLFRKRELTEFCGKLGEFCEKLGEFASAHQLQTAGILFREYCFGRENSVSFAAKSMSSANKKLGGLASARK